MGVLIDIINSFLNFFTLFYFAVYFWYWIFIFKNHIVWYYLPYFKHLPCFRSAKSNNSSLNKAKLDLTFEKSLKGQVEAAMKKKETKPLIEAMGQMLLTQDKKNHRYHKKNSWNHRSILEQSVYEILNMYASAKSLYSNRVKLPYCFHIFSSIFF